MALRELLMPDYVGAFNQGQQIGQERRRRKALSDYLQPAIAGDEGALAAVYKADPEAGIKAQQLGEQQKTTGREKSLAELKQSAALYATAPPEIKSHLYGKIRSLAESLDFAPPGQLPMSLDTPEAQQGFEKFMAAISGQGATETPSAIRELQMLQQNPELAALDMKRRQAGWRPSLVGVPTGDGGQQQMIWDPTARSFQQPNYGGGQMMLDDALANAVMQQESGGDPNAVSPAGAQGLMQIMPGTQRDPGFGIMPARDGSPQENVRLGRDYLQKMLERYNGNQQLALAAYNAGPGRVDAALKSAGGNPQAAIAALPAETRNYVPSVQKRMGYTPPKSETKAPSEFERKLEIARQMGALPEQLKQMVMGESGGGKPSATQIKLANTAKQKLIDLTAIENQLQKVEATFEPLRGSMSAGPYIGGFIPSESGKRFDGAVSLLQGMVRKLTRTPGEGAMSDYETKLAQLANPSRSEYESVTQDQIQQLRDLIATTRQGYEALLQDAGGSAENIPAPKSSQPSIDALLEKYK